MPAHPERVAIALGSNLGERGQNLEEAVAALRAILTDVVVSHFLNTAPVDVAPQPDFLNGALVGATVAAPRVLLDRLLEIEQAAGRRRMYAGAPRTIDLDLILYGNRIINEPGLVVPHPRFRQRRFVLEPLAAIAPEMWDPVTKLTVRQLLERLAATD